MQLDNYEDLLKERRQKFEKRHNGSKVEYDFQEVGLVMQPYFKENIWFLFHHHDLEDIKYAFDICKKNDVFSVGYLKAVIRNKYNPPWMNKKK